jgi:hypothetical protein
MHVTVNCFAAGAAIDQIMYFIILYEDTELRLKKKSAATVKVSGCVRTVTIIAYIYTSINRLRICVIYHLVPAVFCVLSVPIAFVNSEVPESGELFSLKWHNCKYH